VPSTTRNRRLRKCTLAASAGTLTLAGKAGSDRVLFDGRLTAATRLKRGSYRATVVASDPAGLSAQRTLTFTVQ
jgi:hypothetical protein